MNVRRDFHSKYLIIFITFYIKLLSYVEKTFGCIYYLLSIVWLIVGKQKLFKHEYRLFEQRECYSDLQFHDNFQIANIFIIS